jgi:hypothetical protein
VHNCITMMTPIGRIRALEFFQPADRLLGNPVSPRRSIKRRSVQSSILSKRPSRYNCRESVFCICRTVDIRVYRDAVAQFYGNISFPEDVTGECEGAFLMYRTFGKDTGFLFEARVERMACAGWALGGEYYLNVTYFLHGCCEREFCSSFNYIQNVLARITWYLAKREGELLGPRGDHKAVRDRHCSALFDHVVLEDLLHNTRAKVQI